jgi:hypothetical protein
MAKKPIKPQSTEVANYDEELAAAAAQQTAVVKSQGRRRFTFPDGKLYFDGEEVENNNIDLIVIDCIYENQFYKGRYDPDDNTSPVCYAHSRNKDDLVPSDNSAEKQSDVCATCPNNEWESADTGRGKACKNVMQLACIPYDSEMDIEGAEVVTMKLSVTNVKHFEDFHYTICRDSKGKLVNNIFSVALNISTEADKKNRYKIVLSKVADIEKKDQMRVLKKLREFGDNGLVVDYQKPEEKETKKVDKSKFSKKKAK